MNYAWANPLTGLREQTEQSTTERMLAEAKWRVWNELQELNCPWCEAGNPRVESSINPGLGIYVHTDTSIGRVVCRAGSSADGQDECRIYAQDPIGSVSLNGPAIDFDRANAVPKDSQFAWTDPESGKRMVAPLFSKESAGIVDQLKAMQSKGEHTPDVIVYATWVEYLVKRSDPMPPMPAEEFGNPVDSMPDNTQRSNRDAISEGRAKLEQIAELDDQTTIAKITAWALLDIAEGLRKLGRTDSRESPDAFEAESGQN